MKKSFSLNNQNTCANYSDIDVYKRSEGLMRASAQKNVMRRLCLTDEVIPDIKGELRSILAAKGYKWENFAQMKANLELMARRIEIMAQYFHGPYIETGAGNATVEILPCDAFTPEQRTIDYFGEELEVVPDFIRIERNAHGEVRNVNVGKMSSGKWRSEKADSTELEVYALGELGRKLFPLAEVHVDMCHLASNKEPDSLDNVTYNAYGTRNMTSVKIDARTDAYFRQRNIEEGERQHTCSEGDCAGCFKANICHYEEAPVASDVERIIRPLDDLSVTAEQQAVINFREGIACVNAGAGAGKTLTVALRIKALLEDGVDPSKIALLTFTKAGAGEMVARTKAYCQGLDVDVDKITAATFDSFCMDILSEHYEELGYTQPPQIISEEMKSSVINELLEAHPKISSWNYKTMTDVAEFVGGKIKTAIRKAKVAIDTIKKLGWTRANNNFGSDNWNETDRTMDIEKKLNDRDITRVFGLYDAFNNKLKSLNLMEYPDLIRSVFKIAETNPDIFKQLVVKMPEIPDGTQGFVDDIQTEPIYSGYEYIIVDEFQDTDEPQIDLLKKLIDTPDFKGLMVVGDDSQSIFGFRFTSPEYIINFERYFGERTTRLQLVNNFRSTKEIINFANKINSRAISKVNKDLISPKPLANKKPIVAGFYSHEQEFEYIVNSIKADLESGVKPSSIAFLGRDKGDIREIASLLTKMDYEACEFDENGVPLRDENGELLHHTEHGIPSVICNPVPYSKNSRVAALCAFFDSWLNGTTQGFLDFANVRRHGALKDATLEELAAVRDSVMNLLDGMPRNFENFMNLAEQMDPMRRDDCFQAFLEKIEIAKNIDPSHDPTTALKNFFRDFKLYGADECFRREGNYEGVCLTTVHSSKGLEWDTTYLSVTKFDDVRNHTGASYTHSYMLKRHDEDIRLLFVGCTRAKEKLVVSGEYLLRDKKNSFQTRGLKNTVLYHCYEDAGLPYTYSTHDYYEYMREHSEQPTEQTGRTSDELLSQIATSTTETMPGVESTGPARRGRRRATQPATQPAPTAAPAQEQTVGEPAPVVQPHGDHGDGVYLFDDGHAVNINNNVDIEEAIREAEANNGPQRGVTQ